MHHLEICCLDEFLDIAREKKETMRDKNTKKYSNSLNSNGNNTSYFQGTITEDN